MNDGVTSSAQNHSPGSETETEAETEVSELKGLSARQRNTQTKTPERMNSCLTTGAADQQTVTDWQTELKMAMRSLRHTKPTGSLKQDLFFRPHGETVKNSLPSLYVKPSQAQRKEELEPEFSFGGLFCFFYLLHVSQLSFRESFSQR